MGRSKFDVGGFDFYAYGDPGPSDPGTGFTTQAAFGWQDVVGARNKGASDFQLWQLYDRAVREQGEQAHWDGTWANDPQHARHGLVVHGNVLPKMQGTFRSPDPNIPWRGTPVSPRVATPGGWTYENYGGYGFGMADVDAIGATIGNIDKLKEHRMFALQHGIGVGEGVDETISGLDADRRAEEMRKFHQELADQQAERDRLYREQEAAFQRDLLAQQEAAAAEQQRISEEAAHHASLVKGSSPTGVGGAASIKGSRLSITEAGGRKGTKRFSRPTEWMNTLAIGQGGPAQGKSTVTL